ncbi:MAG: hypothetical protein RI897_3687 [Verrucomicrobiota bacterium]|jgi:hypothetical protein
MATGVALGDGFQLGYLCDSKLPIPEPLVRIIGTGVPIIRGGRQRAGGGKPVSGAWMLPAEPLMVELLGLGSLVAIVEVRACWPRHYSVRRDTEQLVRCCGGTVEVTPSSA